MPNLQTKTSNRFWHKTHYFNMKQQGYVYKGNQIKPSSELKLEVEVKEKYLVWHIQGGLGKNIAGTALIRDLKEFYSDRKLIMVVSYPEVFLNNPNIDRVYQIGQAPYFYQDYIEEKDTLMKSKMYLKVNLDIDISFEEAN